MAEETGLMSWLSWARAGRPAFQVGTEVGAITFGRGMTLGALSLNSALAYFAVSAAFEAGIGVGSLAGAGLDEATSCAEAYAP
jgi:hypothetical protein